MYAVSKAYTKAIKGRNRNVEWYGHITSKDGSSYDFNNSDIVESTGTLSKSCSSQSSIDLGGVYASELQISLRLDADRYKLSEAEIQLFVRLNYMDSVKTWGDVSDFSWADLKCNTWGDKNRKLFFDVPMGVFTVSEALRTVNGVKITAYDDMLKFDKTLPTMDTQSRTAFEWLRWICDACGVSLAMTNNTVRALPNGRRSLKFADVNNEISTYRDLLSELATVLASVAMIDRNGSLVLGQYTMNPVDEIQPAFRYTSDFSDYQSYYTGMYASYKAKATQEYFRNVGQLDDNGMVMDIGYNSFLQIANDYNRDIAAQAIIDSQLKNKYTPFNVTLPLHPAYDLMDVLSFSGNQATTGDVAPITSITYKVHDKMTMQCVGENPKLITAQSKENKAIAGLSDGIGLSGTSYVSSDFWIMIDSFPEETTEITEESVTTEIKVNTTVDNTRTQILWTGCYDIDEDAEITASVYIDDVNIYSVTDLQAAGTHTFSVSTGHEITTKGEHIIQVSIEEVVKS